VTGLYSAVSGVADDLQLLRGHYDELLHLTCGAIVEIDAGDESSVSDAVDTLHAMVRAMRAELQTMKELAERLEPARLHLHAIEYGGKA